MTLCLQYWWELGLLLVRKEIQIVPMGSNFTSPIPDLKPHAFNPACELVLYTTEEMLGAERYLELSWEPKQ
jgi:hypothetical protein